MRPPFGQFAYPQIQIQSLLFAFEDRPGPFEAQALGNISIVRVLCQTNLGLP